ncbi:MAG: regulatory protein RecX [Clostridiales bacterium]|jgi:regulatory protein|nr:regulatory protein RecX [Clostridiales bacterium]
MKARITKIERLKNSQDRYVLHFEDETKLKVAGSLIAKFSLFSGCELEQDELQRLKSELESHNVRARAAAMVGARPLSEQELKRKLIQKGSSERDAEDAAAWLEEIGAIDDAKYASTLVRHYSARGYGRAKIRDEFWKRGIPRDIWDEALEEYSTDEDSMQRFIEARLKNGAERREIKRVSDALYRRGFSWDEIKNALAKYIEDFPE